MSSSTGVAPGVVAGQVRGFLSGRGIDLRDRDAGAFTREQDGGGAAYAGTGTGDEGGLVFKAVHV